MIKIIKGSYGMKVGKSVVRIDAGAAPIELDKDKEDRLVRIGVAEYVDEKAETPAADPEATPEATNNDGETDESENVDELPEYSEDMKLDELKKIAEAYGVDASGLRSKKDVIAAIEEAKEAPAFNADDAVE